MTIKDYWHFLAFCLAAGIVLVFIPNSSYDWVVKVAQWLLGFFFGITIMKALKAPTT